MSGSPFELEPDGQSDPPDLPGKAMVFASDEEAIAAAIRELHSAADTAVRERGRFHLAVSGNVSLEPMWAQLMIDPDLRMFPWPQTHLWITASEADRSSTQRRVQESLILPSGIPAEQVHAMLCGEPQRRTQCAAAGCIRSFVRCSHASGRGAWPTNRALK
jgi:6-phosphogluconolactonase/glucosamine-6-phosphate isomerase/deaminase